MIADQRVLAVITSSGGNFYEFFMTVALAIPPLTVKNMPCALIRACALNRTNMVCAYKWGYRFAFLLFF